MWSLHRILHDLQDFFQATACVVPQLRVVVQGSTQRQEASQRSLQRDVVGEGDSPEIIQDHVHTRATAIVPEGQRDGLLSEAQRRQTIREVGWRAALRTDTRPLCDGSDTLGARLQINRQTHLVRQDGVAYPMCHV